MKHSERSSQRSLNIPVSKVKEKIKELDVNKDLKSILSKSLSATRDNDIHQSQNSFSNAKSAKQRYLNEKQLKKEKEEKANQPPRLPIVKKRRNTSP